MYIVISTSICKCVYRAHTAASLVSRQVAANPVFVTAAYSGGHGQQAFAGLNVNLHCITHALCSDIAVKDIDGPPSCAGPDLSNTSIYDTRRSHHADG